MPKNKISDELLNTISAYAQLGNTIDEAAILLRMTTEEFLTLLDENDEALHRWMKGPIEAVNQLKVALTRQAIAGSVPASSLLLKIRGQMDRKSAPLTSATTSAQKEERRGAAWRPKRIAEVAEELQVSASFLRNAINDPVHPLVKEVRAGEWLVKPGDVYDWIVAHAKRRPPRLVEPKGYTQPKEEPAPAQSTGDDVTIADLDPERILRDVEGDTESSSEEKRARIALVGVLLRKIENDLKRQKMLALGDVVKIIRSFGAFLVESLEGNAEPLALEIARLLRDQLDIDLRDRPAASQLLISTICAQAAKILIPGIHQRMQDEVDGVQILEFGGEA